jgi:hypothetical protein
MWLGHASARINGLLKMSSRHSDRQESFPGDGNHDVHKITHSAESERFGPCGLSP